MVRGDISYGKARLKDISALSKLIESKAIIVVAPKKSLDLCATIRDYFLAKQGKNFIGCLGLRFLDEKTAEVTVFVGSEDSIHRLMELAKLEAEIMEARKMVAKPSDPKILASLGFKKSMGDLMETEIIDTENTPLV